MDIYSTRCAILIGVQNRIARERHVRSSVRASDFVRVRAVKVTFNASIDASMVEIEVLKTLAGAESGDVEKHHCIRLKRVRLSGHVGMVFTVSDRVHDFMCQHCIGRSPQGGNDHARILEAVRCAPPTVHTDLKPEMCYYSPTRSYTVMSSIPQIAPFVD